LTGDVLAQFYSKQECDTLFTTKSSGYTKQQADSKFVTEQDFNDFVQEFKNALS